MSSLPKVILTEGGNAYGLAGNILIGCAINRDGSLDESDSWFEVDLFAVSEPEAIALDRIQSQVEILSMIVNSWEK